MRPRSSNKRERDRFNVHPALVLAAIFMVNCAGTTQAPPTSRQYLDSAGIGSSVAELQQALKDKRVGVRSAAAVPGTDAASTHRDAAPWESAMRSQ